MRQSILTALIVLIALEILVVPGVLEAQEIRVDQEFPVRGETATVTVTGADGRPRAGDVVEVTYRPTSETQSTETLPPPDAAGQVIWTPRDAGIVTLAVEDLASHNVAVRFGRFPAAGLGIMILAGLLLFGGAGVGFVTLLRSPEPAEPLVGEPPST